MKRTIKKLQFNAERIRTLTSEQLRTPVGGMRAVSAPTDEMGECNSCDSCWNCSRYMCPPPPPF